MTSIQRTSLRTWALPPSGRVIPGSQTGKLATQRKPNVNYEDHAAESVAEPAVPFVPIRALNGASPLSLAPKSPKKVPRYLVLASEVTQTTQANIMLLSPSFGLASACFRPLTSGQEQNEPPPIMKRRRFLQTSFTVSALASLGQATEGVSAADSSPKTAQEYYELRAYRIKSGSDHALLDAYLEKAAIPAYNRLGIKNVGAFTDMETRDSASVYVLIPHPTIQSFATAGARIDSDPAYQQAGKDYLQTPKSNPGFQRIDSWLLLAFAGMPKLELPPYCRDKKARIFEMRTYESYSELKAIKKVDMFNAGEIDAMREVGLGPIFYGQTLIGRDVPHLIYMTSGENLEVHKKHWEAFGSHATWKRLLADHQYDDTVSKHTVQMLVPTPYSQI
jgi:hypothetical protein